MVYLVTLIESIIRPFLGIFYNIGADAFMFSRIANDVVVVARLPGKGDLVLAGKFRHPDFKPAHNRRQVLRLRPEPVAGWWRRWGW